MRPTFPTITSIVLFPDPTQKTQTLRMYRYPSTGRVPDRGGALWEGCDWFESEPPLLIRGKPAPGTDLGGGEVASEHVIPFPPQATWCRPWRQKAGANTGTHGWQSRRRSRPRAPSCRPIVPARAPTRGCRLARNPNSRYVGGGRSPRSSTAHARPQRRGHGALQRSGRFPTTLPPPLTTRGYQPTRVATVLFSEFGPAMARAVAGNARDVPTARLRVRRRAEGGGNVSRARGGTGWGRQ